MKTSSAVVIAIVLILTSSCKGQELLHPFISWSNNDLLMNLPQKDDVYKLTIELSRREVGKVDAVLIFISKQLSFDHIARSGDIFTSASNTTAPSSHSHSNAADLHSTGNSFMQLRKVLESSRSHYWTGYKSVGTSNNWIRELASQMGLQVNYITNNNDISMMSSDSWKGFHIIDLPDTEDDTIQSVMNKVGELKLRYLAIYTGGLNENKQVYQRSARSLTDRSAAIVSNDGSNDDSSCQIGGAFNSTIDGSPCLLFCMRKNVTFVPNVTNSDVKCLLRAPYEVTWCCDSSNGQNMSSSACNNETNPSVTLHYIIENITSSSGNDDDNICDKKMFQSGIFPERPEQPRFENARPQILVSLKFEFTSNLSYNSHSWNIQINTTYTYLWLAQEEMEPDNQPPDDKQNQGTLTYSSFTYRQSPDQKLFLPFAINYGLSYSCSSEEYNIYTINSNYTSNGSTVIIKGIQVQPFNVSSTEFASSDNCVGYFTVTSWMGIVTMGTLLLILYVSIVAAFSITSIDSFEDSREETYKVEKLH